MRKIFIFVLVVILIITFCPISLAIEIPDGAYGIIWIPCLNVKMPVYTAEVRDHDHEQAVIDNEQSALIENWGVAYDIGDHVFSDDGNGNEWDIQKIFCGAYAWLYTKETHYFLECYMTGKTEYYDGSELICGRLITPCSSHDIMLSCCAEDSQHHFIAVFRRIGEYD